MSDERDTFESTRARLEDIAAQVRKKDTSLDQSIELLEEGVRLANLCTEQVDQVGIAPAEASGDGDEVAIQASEVVTAEEVVREARAAEHAHDGDDFDLSDAWGDLDDAHGEDAEPAVSESQEVLELAADEGAAQGESGADADVDGPEA